MTRLTFVGDIALDKPLLKAARERGKGEFDFSDVFHTQDVFAKSDLVIGNLETVFGGGHRFNKKPYHYNSPDSFCWAIKDAGIGLVGTANNHCIDEGVAGIRRTNQLLDECGILHTGTYDEDSGDRFLVKELRGVKIAFYALTYSVNVGMEALSCRDLYRHVNLLGFRGKRASWPRQYYQYVIKRKLKQFKRKRKKQSTISAHQDTFHARLINQKWMEEIKKQLARAREQADVLVVLLHIGGQFNEEPGEYSKYMMDQLCELGADIVIGNHPHTVQRVERRGDKLVAYCMSVSGEYLVHDCLPEYSLALHVDVDEKLHTFQASVDVLKGSEDKHAYLSVNKADRSDPGAKVIQERIAMSELERKPR